MTDEREDGRQGHDGRSAPGGLADLDAVRERIEANRDDQVEFLRRLVRERSVRGSEVGVQRVVADEWGRIGLRPETYDVDPDVLRGLPGFLTPEWSYPGRPNVHARWEGAGGGRSLVLQGHVDVVPATPERFWTHEPWSGEVVDGRMYGRGAADMKAGIAALTYAVRALREAGIELAGDVLLDTVIEEECTGNGALMSLARGAQADAAIIPEPFGQTALVAQVGVLWARVTVRGAGAHVLGADSEAAVNAVQLSRVVIDAIAALEREVNEAGGRPEAFAHLPHPLNYNVGTIHAGDWPSTVPSECVIEVRLSAFPGEDSGEVRRRFEARIAEACRGDPWLRDNPAEIAYFGFDAEGFVLDADTPILATLEAAHRQVMGEPLERYVSTATTDARIYQLYYAIPTTCYGPVGANLHAPDEWVDLQSMIDTTLVLALAVLDWCGPAAAGPRLTPEADARDG
ncbi:MAG: ArgE/DapE family deacylase [Trueperaceae bacterium]